MKKIMYETISQEEWIKRIEEAQKIEDSDDDIDIEMTEMKSDKKPPPNPDLIDLSDITDNKMNEIANLIKSDSKFKIGMFVMSVGEYFGGDFYLQIFEEKYEVHLGRESKMLKPFDIRKDKRFELCRCRNKFRWGGRAENITKEEICEVFRFLKSADKLKAFL